MQQNQKPAWQSTRVKLFTYFLARLGDPKEAAVRAGYPPDTASIQAAELLGQKRVRELVAEQLRLAGEESARAQALQALRRLALAPVNDAVALAMAEEGALPALDELDLFHVSEIKRTKGGCEIKFFDRLPAVQALLQHGCREENGGGELLQALERGARSLEEEPYGL